MTLKKSKGTELSVFKGIEAKLNRAIIKVLTIKQPQSTKELRKKITKKKA